MSFEFIQKTTQLALEQLSAFNEKTNMQSHMKSMVMTDRMAEVDSIIAILNSIKAQLKARRHDR